jgi:tripartite-type tricarboxylate transporter receptor subunit TctC
VSPALYRNTPGTMVDPVRDFAPVSLAASVPFFLVASADTGWQSARERRAPRSIEHTGT